MEQHTPHPEYNDLPVLVVGAGAIGKRHIEVLYEMGVKNQTVCDPFPAALDVIRAQHPEFGYETDYTEALKKKPFAVFILTPTKMHIPMAIQALEAGAHVFIEKPLSNSSEGIEDLKAAAEKANRKVMIGFCFRYHEALLEAKKLLDAGKIGRLVSVRALMGECFPSIHPEYKSMYLSKYSGAFELIHDLDLAIWFAGQKVRKTYGVYGAFSNYEFESPDTVEMLLEFEDRCTASVHLDFFQTPRRRKTELIGTDGVITVDFASWDEADLEIYEKSKGAWEKKHFETRRNDMFIDEDTEFLEAALHDLPIKCTIDEAAKSLCAVESIYKPY